MIFSNQDKEEGDREVFLARAQHSLKELDERIEHNYEKLEKVSKIVEQAAESRDKTLLKRALMHKKQYKEKLEYHLGYQQRLRKITDAILDKGLGNQLSGLIQQGTQILKRMGSTSPDMDQLAVKADKALKSHERSKKAISEPLSGSSNYEIEEEAERLIAEHSLPDTEKEPVKEKEKEEFEEADLEDIEKQLKDLGSDL